MTLTELRSLMNGQSFTDDNGDCHTIVDVLERHLGPEQEEGVPQGYVVLWTEDHDELVVLEDGGLASDSYVTANLADGCLADLLERLRRLQATT